MTELEREVLDLAQEGLPFVERPFLEIANRLKVSEEEVVECLRGLKERRLIRRFGGIMDVNALGIQSTLVCMKVNEQELDRAIEIINTQPGVTHNYERDHDYNVWFTVMEATQERLQGAIASIQDRVHVEDMLILPSRKKYKTKVIFELSNQRMEKTV